MKKLYYFNLNNEHSAGEQSIYDYNRNNIEWYSTKVPVFVNWTGIAHLWYDFTDFDIHMSVDEISKPIFDYYRKYENFDRERIQELYYPQFPTLPYIEQTIENLEKNIADVREIQPDIIFIRYYFGYEFLYYYFLKAVKDLNCTVVLGGNVIDYADPYYLNIYFKEGLIDNYHFGYGEQHLANIIDDVPLSKYTSNLNVLFDDYSVPRSEAHWLKTTLQCNGGCKFCALTINHADPGVNMMSEEYVEQLMHRIKYLEEAGVKYLMSPGSITFFNKAHIRLFHKKYKEHDLKMMFIDSFFKFSDFDDEIIDMLHDMNFYSIKIGLENINPTLRQQLGKYFSNDLVYKTLTLLDNSNIKYKISILFNTPFDTIQSTIDNITFLKEYNIKYAVLNKFYLVKHTDIYDNYQNYNLNRIVNDHGYIMFNKINYEDNYSDTMRELEQQFYATIDKPYRTEYLKYTDKFHTL